MSNRPGLLHLPATLSRTSCEIVVKVIEAMNIAEELGGPEGKEYLVLMDHIAAEAKARRDVYASVLNEEGSNST